MFGSNYILNPVGRLLWCLRTAWTIADERGGFLAEVAAALRKVDALRISPLAELPLIRLACAVLSNLVRFEAGVPDWVIGTLLCGATDALGIKLYRPRGVLASPAGFLYRMHSTQGVVAENLATGELRKIVDQGPLGLFLLGDSELLHLLVGDEKLSSITADPILWRPQLVAGLSYLRIVSPAQERCLLDHVSLIASFDEPPGLLQSLSAGELPGFILLRADNGPAEVADQLVHETAHQMLDRYLAGQPALVEELLATPSAYSPFFQQPRPALKLLHGLVSYLEVLRFWQAVIFHEGYGTNSEHAVAFKRRTHVEQMCEIGCRALRASVTEMTWTRWSEHINALCPTFAPLCARLMAEQRTVKTTDLIKRLDILPWLSPIERAELLLAFDGQKLSRLSLSLQHGAELARSLDPLLSPLYSRKVFVTGTEQYKGNFSNLPEGSFEYYRPPQGATVFAYVSRNQESLVAAVRDDEVNKAGDALGIPTCCQEHFTAHWPEAIKHFEGDLLAWSLDALNVRKVAPFDLGNHAPENNAFAMVLGSGITWHFPCSFDCTSTVEVIGRRKNALERLDASLAEKLWQCHRTAVVWTPDRAFFAAPISWSNGVPIVITREAVSPEWTAALRQLAHCGSIVRINGVWYVTSGEMVESILPLGSHILLFDKPPIDLHET